MGNFNRFLTLLIPTTDEQTGAGSLRAWCAILMCCYTFVVKCTARIGQASFRRFTRSFLMAGGVQVWTWTTLACVRHQSAISYETTRNRSIVIAV